MRAVDAEEGGASSSSSGISSCAVSPSPTNGHQQEERQVAVSAADVKSLLRTSQRRTLYYHNAARLALVVLLSVFVAVGMIYSSRTRLRFIGGGGVTTSTTRAKGNGTTGVAMDEIEVFDLVADLAEPAHLSPIDPTSSLRPHVPDPVVSIDDAHRMGLIHVGTWVFLTSSDSKLLLLRRGPDLVTCPNSWMPLGEHSLPEDSGSPSANALRGVREELGPAVIRDHMVFDTNLTSFPVYYIRDYGPDNGDRIDRQVTYLWHVGLNVTSDRLGGSGDILDVDDEVDALDWFPATEVEKWMEERPGDFCHETIRAMLAVGLAALKKAEAGGKWGEATEDAR